MSNNIERMTVDGASHEVGLRNIYINEKGNFNIETSSNLGNTKKGKINIEGMDDVQIKPGDDIIFYSHHRPAGKNDEVSLKVHNGDDVPVKLQINAANLTITTKDKDLTATYPDDTNKTEPTSSSAESEIFDVNINTGNKEGNKKGYLKVRARAIDLRCEEHGGVALQPNGYDSEGKENKIKFEHGGGDGLEFGTFNTQKSSLYTDEYRFNKYGVVKAATRKTEVSDKYENGNETTHYKYQKQADDFYDVIDETDEQATWNSIIKTGNAFNDGKNRHAKITSSGNLEIETCKTYQWEASGGDAEATWEDSNTSDVTKIYNEGDFTKGLPDPTLHYSITTINNGVDSVGVYRLKTIDSPNINLESGGKMKLDSAKDITITTGTGNTDYLNINTPQIKFEYKLSKKGNIQGADPTISYVETNNYGDGSSLGWTGDQTKDSSTSISCKLSDIIKLVNYAKNQNWI